MKTVKCSNCKQEKPEDEFYWHHRESKTLRSTECKNCINEKAKQKRIEKCIEKLSHHIW